jgi:O-antigen/teichoic acid export membrane protein
MASIRKSLAYTIAQQYGCAAIAFVSIVILARLLTPSEVGIYSVSAAVIGIAHMIRDFGIGRYLIQEPDLTIDRFRTAFGVGIAISWMIAVVLYLGRGYVAEFYGDGRLREVTSVLAFNFFLIPIGSPILWMLMREMKFGQLFFINISTQIIQSATSIALAVLGFSYMSMAWGSVAGVVTTAFLATLSDRRHVLLRPSFKAWRRVIGFGSWASAQSLVSELGNSATDLVLGRTLGFDAVALFSRAQGLIATIHRDIIKAAVIVTFPMLAERHRQGTDLHEPYEKGTAYLTALTWPVIALLGIIAHPLIEFLFGPNWKSSAPLLQILCASAWLWPVSTLASQTLLALGHIKLIFRIDAVAQTLRVIAIVVGSMFGLAAVAALQFVPTLVATVMWLWCAETVIGTKARALLRPGLQGVGVVLFASAGPLAVALLAGQTSKFMILALSGTLWAAGWLIGIFVVRHPIREEVLRVQASLFGTLAAARTKRR